jgi:hypothetical protein
VKQWLAESHRCFRLGKQRLDAGRSQPIEQAWCLIDLCAVGNTVTFFRCRIDGVILPRSVTLARDARRRKRVPDVEEMLLLGAAAAANADTNSNANSNLA